MITVLAVLAAAALGAVLAGQWRSAEEPDPRVLERIESMRDSSDSLFDRGIASLARPVSSMPLVRKQARSSHLSFLEDRLAAAGGLYGGSVEVFLSMQVASALVAALGILGVLAVDLPTFATVGAVLLLVGIAGLPYNRIHKAAQEREEQLVRELPDFVEQLIMALEAGQSLIPALRTVSERNDGLVATEMRTLLSDLRATRDPEEAFASAAQRLGTAQGTAFANSLLQCHTTGTRVKETLRNQAELLRDKYFNLMLERAKRMEMPITIGIVAHFFPLLIFVVLIPLVIGF